MPDGTVSTYERASRDLPPQTAEILPHPYGVELGVLQGMLKDSKARHLAAFLHQSFSRVSARVAEEICVNAQLSSKAHPARIGRTQIEALMQGIERTKIMNPPTDCVAPIGEEQLIKGLASVVSADFYASTTRPPAVYRGNPFIIEAALAYGGKQEGDQPARVLRYANRVPLLYQQGACCSYASVTRVNWRNYDLQQPRSGVPAAPLTIVVHMASVWVPFTSESKEAIADYPEITDQIELALQECGRKLRLYISAQKRTAEADRKRSYVEHFIPHIGIGLRQLVGLSQQRERQVVERLTGMLERSRE
jgi:DNA topoisomerase-6 subunit B